MVELTLMLRSMILGENLEGFRNNEAISGCPLSFLVAEITIRMQMSVQFYFTGLSCPVI